MRFTDRENAGQLLADAVGKRPGERVVVYALPRGGVVLGKIIAERLGAPLSLRMPRKIGHPDDAELAIAAVTEGGVLVEDPQEVAAVDRIWFDRQVANERTEAHRRRELYLSGGRPLSAKGSTAIIVDDGVATGLTMRAAIAEVLRDEPVCVVVAVPVAPQEVAHALAEIVDEVIVLHEDAHYLGSVGAYYEDFSEVDDDEVVRLLGENEKTAP